MAEFLVNVDQLRKVISVRSQLDIHEANAGVFSSQFNLFFLKSISKLTGSSSIVSLICWSTSGSDVIVVDSGTVLVVRSKMRFFYRIFVFPKCTPH